MARVLVTGSSDGIGLLADQLLLRQGYWYHQRRRDPHPAASDPTFQDELIDCCASLSGVPLPN